MQARQITWWLVFLIAAMPALVMLGLFYFNPRALGVDPVEVVLNESGQWAFRFLLITLVCSPLRRLGFKQVARFRRMLGLYAFAYASLHLVTYIGGWNQWQFSAFYEDVIRRPFIYLGMIAWAILFVLAITSLKHLIKLLKKRWIVVHRFVYLSAVLVWVHVWMQSRASAGEAIAYGLILLLLFVERAVRSFRAKRLV